MENFTWVTPTKYVFGRGVVEKIGALAQQAGMHYPLIVYGGGSAVRSGLLDSVKRHLAAVGIAGCPELGGIKPNPTDDKVYEGIALCRQKGCDSVIAVGGGSVIDTAKAIAAGVVYNGDFWDYWAGKLPCTQALPVGVVLTIPAAGSEGSGNSVITKLDGMHKISLRSEYALRPKFAVMDPEVTFTLPPYQTACGIVDMMCHIFERYFTPTTDTEVTDRVAEGVLRAIIHEAPKVMKRPDDYQARANIMWAGTLAHNGVCGTGRVEDWVSHFMEHEVSAVYGVAHGAGLAVMAPAWQVYMAHHCPERGAQLARRVFDVHSDEPLTQVALEGIGRLREFFRSLGMPLTLRELGIENPDIDLLVQKLHENKGKVIGGYYALDAQATREIYEMAR